MPPDYWQIGKKQHFICSNLTLFIVPFFLSFFFLFFLSFFIFSFFLSFFLFPGGGEGATAPSPPQMMPLIGSTSVHTRLYLIIIQFCYSSYRTVIANLGGYKIIFDEFVELKLNRNWIQYGFIRVRVRIDGFPQFLSSCDPPPPLSQPPTPYFLLSCWNRQFIFHNSNPDPGYNFGIGASEPIDLRGGGWGAVSTSATVEGSMSLECLIAQKATKNSWYSLATFCRRMIQPDNLQLSTRESQ